MDTEKTLAARLFTTDDQNMFAQLSGDRNPMHMDEAAARRTQAGTPVVHGIHALLWSLDCLVWKVAVPVKVLNLQVGFKRWIHIGKMVNLILSDISASRAKLRLEVDGLLVVTISVDFDSSPGDFCLGLSSWEAISISEVALEADMAESSGSTGFVGFPSVSDRVATAWPNLAGAIGPSRVAALMATSTLVGMKCPGLHSMYKELRVNFCSLCSSGIEPGLVYRVLSYDERFRLAQIWIEGRGVGHKVFTGTVKAVAPLPPVKQPSIAEISMSIRPNEFSQTCSLIVGGSRGLGELTAKALVAGGGKVILTYAVGKSEADRVHREIVDGGGTCETMHYDVKNPAAAQLEGLKRDVTHVYYYATPTIYQSKGRLFVEERFSLFVEFYLKGFFDLCNSILKVSAGDVKVLYPSTVFAAERPQDMTEYAMAKVAGEVLCADINRFMDGVKVLVKRLPKMETDQTASLVPAQKSDSVGIMLPLLREMCVKSDPLI